MQMRRSVPLLGLPPLPSLLHQHHSYAPRASDLSFFFPSAFQAGVHTARRLVACWFCFFFSFLGLSDQGNFGFFFFSLLLPRVTDLGEPGGCWIAMRSCRHRPWLFPWLFPAFCCYTFFSSSSSFPSPYPNFFFPHLFPSFLVWISTKHTISC